MLAHRAGLRKLDIYVRYYSGSVSRRWLIWRLGT